MELKVIGRDEIASVLTMPSVIERVRSVYCHKAQGHTAVWPSVEYRFAEDRGVMDIRSGYVGGDELHGSKLLNNFPGNVAHGYPSLTGLLMVFDSLTGLPQAVMDASRITSMRTGAAAGVGAAALARPDSRTLLIVGTGYQSIFMIAGVLIALPGINQVLVADPLDTVDTEAYCDTIGDRLADELGVDVSGVLFEPAGGIEHGLSEADVVVTITRATSPVVRSEWVRPGTHFSCIGADMHGKQELDPEIFRTSRAFADDLAQCTRFGELELAVSLGIVTPETVEGEVGEVLAGMKPGRRSADDVTVFDATGLALLDIAAAKAVIELLDAAGTTRTIEV